jgi:acetate kinase
MRVLTVNCGSSSLKFDVLDVASQRDDVTHVAGGALSRIGQDATSTLGTQDGRIERQDPVPDHAQGFGQAVAMLREAGLDAGIEAVGHRVVHGGSRFREPVHVERAVTEQIEAAGSLAPLHNGPALAAIRAAAEAMTGVPMVATFDTAFYAELPAVAATYSLPREVSEQFGIRRYGFHGLAHRYMAERFRVLHPQVEPPRLITLQLGNGCSATASIDGRPVDTSMGFTPLEGLIMGTRSGDLDPALPLFLARQEGQSVEGVETMLNEASGLLGLSGRSNDMRDLLQAEAAGDERCGFAVDAFCYRVRKYIGAYLAVLGGADAVVFGGGIGERAPEVRHRICAGLEWAGLILDDDANRGDVDGDRRISAQDSAIEAWVVPVDEASVIARDVAAVLGGAL